MSNTEEQFKPCGEDDNICNCNKQSECGYISEKIENLKTMNELLSGKCKEYFYNWVIDRENTKTNDSDYNVCVSGYLKFYNMYFHKLPVSMQFGVIQDFADEKGIDLDVKIGVDTSTQIKDGFDYSAFNFLGWASTLKEARERAIERFNILYNENK